MFYFTLPVFVFSRTVSVFVGPSTHRVGSNVVSFELQLHSHAGLLPLSLKTSTSVDPPASPPPCGSTSTSTSERHEPQLHHRPCRSPELYLFSRANLTLTWSAGPPIKLLHLMIWEWEHVAINPSDLLLALAIKKNKKHTTNRTCTVIYYHQNHSWRDITGNRKYETSGPFLAFRNICTFSGKEKWKDKDHSVSLTFDRHKNIQRNWQMLRRKSMNTKWHTFVKKNEVAQHSSQNILPASN